MKKLKTIMAIAILILGIVQLSQAQKQTGLYLTYSDYVGHKLSYSNDKVSIHEFLGSANLSVTVNGKTNKIAKNNIFGYHDASGNDYRFCNNLAYQILDTAGFYVYSYDKLVQQGKGPKPTRIYYFSAKPASEVLPLNPENIAKVFPSNHKFYNLVAVEYKANMQLDNYDTNVNKYTIKELYEESLK